MSRIKQECEVDFASKKCPLPRKELNTKIRKQMEIYFGDENLIKDRYLKKLIDEDPWVDLKMFIAFRKIKNLTTDVSRIAKALRKSTMLEISENGTKIRRRISPAVRKKENSEECTVCVQRLPPDADQDLISNLMSQYGPIENISIPKYKNKEIKGFAFVEFKTPKNARKCIKAFRTKGCELSSHKSPNSLLRITTLEDCDDQIEKESIIKKKMKEKEVESENCVESDSMKDNRSQITENGKKKKKKKKKLISIDLTASADEEVEDSKKRKNKRDSGTEMDPSDFVPKIHKKEKEHKSNKRKGKNSESLNASDENFEFDQSSAAESHKKRKKIKHEPTESESTKQSVQKTKTLPEEEICNKPKKRKINESTAGANDTGKNSRNVNTALKKEKESDSESIQEVPSDKVKVKKQKKKKRERNLKKEAGKEDLDASDLDNLKAFRAKVCELSFQTSPNSLPRITTLEYCDDQIEEEPILMKEIKEGKLETENCVESDSKTDNRSHVSENGKKKKKKVISVDLTASADEGVEDSKQSKNRRDSDTEKEPSESVPHPSKMEKEHKSKKRKVRNSEILNVSDGNDELDHSSAFECDKKRKKIKYKLTESESTKKSVTKMKTLPEEEICNNPKKRKINDSTAGANDKGKNSRNINMDLEKEKESDSESIQEIPSDKVKVKKEKKKKREKNLREDLRKENLGDSETGIEIMGKREWKQSRNKYLEMQSCNVEKINTEKEESSEKSAQFSLTPGAIVNIETESPCSDPEKEKAFREKGCRVSSRTSPNSLLSIITLKDCDEDIARKPIVNKEIKEKEVESKNCVESDSKDSSSQVPENEKKKKKMEISIDLTASADEGVEDSKKSKNKIDDSGIERDPSDFVPTSSKMEKEHKSKKRKRRNSESLNASDGNYELDSSSAAEFDKKGKKIKHKASEPETAKQSVQKTKTLTEVEIRSNLEKRKISDSTAVANDEGEGSGNVNTALKSEKESDSESIQEVPSDKVKAKKEKKKRERNLKEETRKEKLGDSETGIEIMGKREWKQSRNKYLEMQRSNIENVNADKEESREIYVVEEEKSTEFSVTPGVVMNNERESACSDPEDVKSAFSVTGRENVVINRNTSHNLSARSEVSQDVSRQDLSNKLQNSYEASQPRSHLPHRLIGLMYQLDLSILCLLRKYTFKHKYPTLSLGFGDSKIDKFNNIVLRYKEKAIYIHIENVEKRHIEDDISYNRLFTKVNPNFSINTYFNSFVQLRISKVESSTNSIEYLIVYTNSGLDLTEEMRLKHGRSKKCYPFKFDSIVNCNILKDFLFTNDNTKKQGFLQFSQDKITREEFLKRLQFSSAVQKVITKRQLSPRFEKDVKEDFFAKLVFAVNQPKRQELNSIIKNEIDKSSQCQYDYTALREKVLCDLTAVEKHKQLGKSVSYIPGIIYEFNLLMLFLHDMFLHKHMLSINYEGKSDGVSNDITINYKGRITCVKTHTADGKIGFSQLFPLQKSKEKNTFSINKHFALFNQELEKDIRYFIIYTNTDLDLAAEKKFKQGPSKHFYPLKFSSIDIQKKKYKILRDCSFINENGLYQFAHDETREKLLSLLKLPTSLQKEKKEGILTVEGEQEVKEMFLYKLIFAVNQPNMAGLNSVVRDQIKNDNESNNIPYNYEELHEIALRWLESDEVGPITQRIMKEIFEDIKNNRLSYQKIRSNINEEIKFAKTVVGSQETFAFGQFLDFLIKEEILVILKRKGVNLVSMANILCESRGNAIKAFKGLYDLWFVVEGSKTRYLKILEENGIRLATMSGILVRAGANAAEAFKELYDLWFDAEENKTQYLKTLEEEGIKLTNMSSILRGAGDKAAKVFKDLYCLWFDIEGNKTQYLKALNEKGINLNNVSNILHGSGANAAKAFENLYNLWFDEEENKTPYLKTLEKKEIKLTNMSSILCGAGADAAEGFKDLYNLWFDINGNKTQYLNTIEANGIKLTNISSILGGARANAAKGFKDLYNLWFDEEGNKTPYLKVLEKKGINLITMTSILHGAGRNAAKSFKDLYDLWFDVEGNETNYLKTLEEKGVNLGNMSSILHGAGAGAVKAFKELCNTFFDAQGNNKPHLMHFIEEEDQDKCFTLRNLSVMLSGSGANAKDAFEKLHSVCFNEKGKRTKLLDDFYNAGFMACDLCSILTAAVGSLKKFHDFCFIIETKKYLNHLLNETDGFTPTNLSKIFRGAGTNICSAVKHFHDIGFDEAGNKTQLLDDFYKAGFGPSDLSNILSSAGSNAASILVNFYKSCFNKDNLLNHFLAEKELFTPTNLSKILDRVGINIGRTFEKLHDLCFDKEGNKTNYFQILIQNNPSHQILNILHKKIRKGRSTFL